MFETLFLAFVALAPIDVTAAPAWPGSILRLTSAPSYQPAERMVDNWRFEGALNLDLSPIQALGLAAGNDLGQTPRCVRLNNYWCIKRAGWNGEIAADSDGHVAFASALEGAAVAALLLRRYYVDYGRHSARAIVSRWAPAQCSTILVSAPRTDAGAPRPAETSSAPSGTSRAISRARVARTLPQRVVPMGLAPRGIGNTLRARWLAAHGRGGVAKKYAAARMTARSRIAAADSVSDLIRAPTIAVGMGEPARKPAIETRDPPRKPASATAFANTEIPEPPLLAPRPIFSCSGETARIASYAARVAEGVAAGPDDDLKLFSPDGAPTEKLPLVMANMASVEIGPLRVSNALIALAVSQFRSLLRSEAPRKAD